MTKLPWWKRTLMLLVAGLAISAGFSIKSSRGFSAEPRETLQAPTFDYRGSLSCKECHSKTKDTTVYTYAKGFIRFDEFPIWSEKDKHSSAFRNLFNDRAKKMKEILGQDLTKKETGCIGCHSASTAEMKTAPQQDGGLFNAQEGVSCENCHGPSDKWYGDHSGPNFYKNSLADREKLGMFDMREPARQAENCLTCHIGNVDKDKVVTHRMYAAGHPPLPSIEVATFSELMPKHWLLPSEKEAPLAKAQRGYKDGDLDNTKLAIVGSAVALKTSMKLLADEAKLPATGTTSGQEWADYARFDCWSCHHDLVRESWRQQRGYVGAPGRVPVSEWPLSLVELGIERLAMIDPAAAAADKADLLRLQKAVRDQADSRPFGRKADIAKAADEFAAWTDVLIKKLGAATYNKDVAEKLLKKLVENEKAKGLKIDFDSARHVSWMIKLLNEELGGKLPNQAKVNEVIGDLDKMLNLNLPAGRKYEIENNLKEALERIGAFEPAKFQEQLDKLLPLL